MSGLQSCVLAYAVGLTLMLGYALNVWIGCCSRRARRERPGRRPEVVVTARTPVRTRPTG